MNIYFTHNLVQITYKTLPIVSDQDLNELNSEPYTLIRNNGETMLKSFAIRDPTLSSFPVSEPIFVSFGKSYFKEGPLIDFVSRFRVYLDINPPFSCLKPEYPKFTYVGIRAAIYDRTEVLPEFDGPIHFIERKERKSPETTGGILEKVIHLCDSLTLRRSPLEDWMNVENIKTLKTNKELSFIPIGVEKLCYSGSFKFIKSCFKEPNSVRILKVGSICETDLPLLSHLDRIEVKEVKGKIPEVDNLWVGGQPVKETKSNMTLFSFHNRFE
jgi:hypothetical protein